jgi:hypothetical protein
MVLTTGPEKAGNHALVKAVELLGIPCEVEHRKYNEGLPVRAKHLFIKRDPRNMILSMLRFEGKQINVGMYLTYFRRYCEQKSLVNYLDKFESWLRHPNTLVIKYEELIESDKVMRQIAEYLGISYIEGSFELLPGITHTWTGMLSDYKVIWTPQIESIWNNEGGPKLLKAWGYD